MTNLEWFMLAVLCVSSAILVLDYFRIRELKVKAIRAEKKAERALERAHEISDEAARSLAERQTKAATMYKQLHKLKRFLDDVEVV